MISLSHAFSVLSAPSNALGFKLREAWSWSPGVPELEGEPKDDLFLYLSGPERRAVAARADELRARYTLDDLRDHSRRIDYLENLYLLDALERCLPGLRLRPDARALDVGSKDWSYVFALQRFCERAGASELELHGVEVDARARYLDLTTRADVAQAHMNLTGAAQLHYHAGDVVELEQGQFDLVTWFYPFLTLYPLLRWGLPARFFRPADQLAAVRDQLRPGGLLLVFNQTREEQQELARLLPPGLRFRSARRLTSRLLPYWQRTQDRWATLLERTR